LRDEYKHFETRIVRYVHTTWEDLLSGDVLLWLRSFTIPFVLILTGKNDSCRLTEGVEDMRKLPMLVKVFTTCTKPAEKYPEIVSIPLGVLNHFTSSEIKLLPHNSTVVLEQLRRDKIKRQGNRRSLIFLNDFIWKNASTHTHFPNWFSHVNSVTTDHYEYYKFEIIPMYQGFVREPPSLSLSIIFSPHTNKQTRSSRLVIGTTCNNHNLVGPTPWYDSDRCTIGYDIKK